MKEQFIPFEMALKLRELGFNENCFGFHYIYEEKQYFSISTICNTNDSWKENDFLSAPLWQQVFDWFREKHNIFIQITHSSNIDKEVGYKYHLRSANKWYDDKVNFNSKIGLIFTYREAQINGINKAIELINP